MLPQIFISKGRMGGGRAEREGGREGGREGETETENLLGVNAHNDCTYMHACMQRICSFDLQSPVDCK